MAAPTATQAVTSVWLLWQILPSPFFVLLSFSAALCFYREVERTLWGLVPEPRVIDQGEKRV